jgi:acetyl esterase/lipase
MITIAPITLFLDSTNMLRCLTVLLMVCAQVAFAEDWKPLWPEGAPGANGSAEHDVPALLAFPAAKQKANGCGVVVCPGGGYGGLAMDHEGHQIAAWLNERGISAWILRYRLGSKGYHHPIQQGDVLRAIRTVRSAAADNGVDPNRIGVWGFSAGGHLASTAATHFDLGDATTVDPIDKVSSRPDFAVLCYPVITMDDAFTHRGSRNNLLGPEKDNPELVELMSNEKQVTKDTPPTFIFHTTEDQAVPVENAIAFYSALRKNGVSSELHIYQKGRHGVGLGGKDDVLSTWPARLEDWLKINGFTAK